MTLSSTESKEVVEVTHEALFEHWQQLKLWLDGQRERIRQQRRVNALAEEWSKQSKRQGYLLQGRQLDDARDFHKRCGDTLPLSGLAMELIRRSLRRRWVNRAMVASLAVIPLMAVEGFLREEAVRRDYATLRGVDVARKTQAAMALVAGCQAMENLPRSLYPVGERVFGNCRSLMDLNLEEVNFHSAELNGADLKFVNLNGANLTIVNLNGADLSFVDLNYANLNGANLRYADLSYAKFNSADLSFANLRGANLNGADFNGANLRDADLRDTRAWTTTQLSEAQLCETTLPEGANLDSTRDCKEMGITPQPQLPVP